MNVNERVGELVDVTKLDSVFETWLSEDLEIRVNRHQFGTLTR